MANPQKEDGYTAIANEIMDALIRHKLSGQQLAITLFVIRKTYGFNKKSDSISLSQMANSIKSSRIRCSQVVSSLVLMNILTVNENINGILKSYSLNKDFDTWTTVNENINRLCKTKETVNVLRKRPLMKTLTTKDTITKDTITKYKASFPDWIPKDTFEEYLAMRRKIKRPLLEKSYKRFFSTLKKLCDTTRSSPEQILDQSIINSWQGIFPLKDGGNGNGRHGQGGHGIQTTGRAMPKEYTGEDIPVPDEQTRKDNIERARSLARSLATHNIPSGNT